MCVCKGLGRRRKRKGVISRMVKGMGCRCRCRLGLRKEGKGSCGRSMTGTEERLVKWNGSKRISAWKNGWTVALETLRNASVQEYKRLEGRKGVNLQKWVEKRARRCISYDMEYHSIQGWLSHLWP